MMSNSPLRLATAAATLLVPLWAFAQRQTLESGGYFRAGPGATKKDASRACYGLSGAGLKYRLGNECDFYGEFLFSTKMKADTVDYAINVMPKLYNGGTDSGSSKLEMQQMFVEGKGFDVAPDVKFWAGKRFYRRADVHIVDTHYIDLSGVGAGASDIRVGPGHLALGWFRNDGGDLANPVLVDDDNDPLTPPVRPGTRHGTRFNVDYADLPVNPGGTLRLLGTFVRSDGDDGAGGRNGLGFSAVHEQARLFGTDLTNQVWLQHARGSAGLNGNFGTPTATSGVRSTRLIDSIVWQQGGFGGQAQVMFQTDRDEAGVKVDSGTVGGRVSYALTRHFKLVSEAGYSQRKADGGATQKLAKFTLAPTLSTGPGFWNRPELRLYVTTAKWNDAANAAAGTGGVTGIGDNATKGTSYGAQVEVWW
ncbi:carbohydrate porin [Rhizobacter sp. Root1221]|uniref:maltoporin n=1 Tax=Rhizobacter sp. Root1221 TaxID=1736433 RepID=UPI0006FFCD7C|nr:carbohydrate porin [Rhizobacter sp. Root1221]KQW00637.1 hypothetical protein ASC87_17415 [Rhizobacter sp. Root1221]